MGFESFIISVATIEMEEICCGCGNVHPSCSGSDSSTCFFPAHAGLLFSIKQSIYTIPLPHSLRKCLIYTGCVCVFCFVFFFTLEAIYYYKLNL